MTSELDQVLQARFKQTEGSGSDSNGSKPSQGKLSSTTKPSTAGKPSVAKPVPGKKPGPKPLPPTKPTLPAKKFNPKVASKINASLAHKPNKPPPLTAKPKLPPSKPATSKSGKKEEVKPSPGAAALATLLQATKKDVTGVSVSDNAKQLFKSSKLSRLEKTRSVEVSKPRSVSDLTNSTERPYSTACSIDEDFLSQSPRQRASPVISPSLSPSIGKRRTISLSPAKSVDSPLTQSPLHTASSSRENSVEPESDQFDKASSLPREASLSTSPQENDSIPTPSQNSNTLGNSLSVQNQKLKARSTSDLRKVNKRGPPPPPSRKPDSKPKMSSSNISLKEPENNLESKTHSNSLPIENPDNGSNKPPVNAVSSSSLENRKLPPRPPPKRPPSPLAQVASDVNRSTSPPQHQAQSPQTSPSLLHGEDSPTPGSPATGVKILSGGSPTIRVTASSISENSSQKRGAKTDSGFGSEAPDEVSMVKGTSVESLPEEAVPGPPSPVTMEGMPGPPSPIAAETMEGPPSPVAAETMEVWDQERLDKARSKRHHIALELLSTEKTYVERIRCIAMDFHGTVTEFNVKNKQAIPQSAVQLIFLNIQQIYQLNENILTALQERMDSWETHEGLGDVIARLAPFLKLYATYTSGFEDAMKTLTDWTKRDKKFDALIRDFERNTLSTGLGVAHYMLEPVQRIPRYRLLLADYLKYLPPDSPDRLDTTKALAIISDAAYRTNDRIKELENSNEILAIQRSLTDFEGNLVTPSRVFLKKGELQKSSRKTETPRMFFLFSDILLHTKPSGTGTYEFKDEMPIFGMRVEVPKVSLVPSFNVHSTSRALILVASSEEERVEWMTALKKVISDDMKKRSSLRRDILPSQTSIDSAGGEFGTLPPIMVPDKNVTMCQTCSAAFTFTFRRHHCRACGKVVCGNCSQSKTYLSYMDKVERVCEQCSLKAKGLTEEINGQNSPIVQKKMKIEPLPSGVLNLKALEDDAVIAAYVLFQDGRNWRKLWYQVKKDFVLYKFKAHEDIKAIHSMPLPGYVVTPDRENSLINLTHPSSKKQLCECFKVEDPVAFESWIAVLGKVVSMQLPQSSIISPTSNRSSLIDSFDFPSGPNSVLNSGEDCNSTIGSRTGSFTDC